MKDLIVTRVNEKSSAVTKYKIDLLLDWDYKVFCKAHEVFDRFYNHNERLDLTQTFSDDPLENKAIIDKLLFLIDLEFECGKN
jgi:hypothetical protein